MLLKKPRLVLKSAYRVRAQNFDGGEYDLSFSTKKSAESYKKLLRESDRQIESKITKLEMIDGFIVKDE